MSEFKKFPGFSEMQWSEGTLRVNWDGIHEKMGVEWIKQGFYLSVHLNLEQGHDFGKELVRLARDAKAKKRALAAAAKGKETV